MLHTFGSVSFKRMEIYMTKKLGEYLNDGEAFLVVSPENRRYLTSFESSDGWLLVTASESIFLTDSRYIEAATARARGCTEIALCTNAAQDINKYISSLGIKHLYLEASRLSVARFNSLSDSLECECLAEKADEAIKALRRTKTAEELNNILAAQDIAERAFKHICSFIKEGVTEREIGLELDYFMLRAGAEALSFETIAVSGKNSSMPHGVPTDKKVEYGDFITMDYGAVVNGYHSDMTRTVALGGVSDKQKKVYETVLEAQLKSLELLAPGVLCKAADAAARDVIANAGYGEFFGHGTGHGVGIEIHEFPVLNTRTNEILAQGDVVTVEPGIYLPGEFGVRIEDMAFITENGAKNLTNCPKTLIIL